MPFAAEPGSSEGFEGALGVAAGGLAAAWALEQVLDFELVHSLPGCLDRVAAVDFAEDFVAAVVLAAAAVVAAVAAAEVEVAEAGPVLAEPEQLGPGPELELVLVAEHAVEPESLEVAVSAIVVGPLAGWGRSLAVPSGSSVAAVAPE